VEYHVVGDGPLQHTLATAAGGLPPGVVRFHGALLPAEVRGLLDGMDVLLSPHRTAPDGDVEGIPNVLKEAMALGIPVVATRHGGIPELVEDGRSGLLADEGDVATLVVHCRHLLDTPAAWATLTTAGRAAVEEGFDMARLNDTLVELSRGLSLREPAGEGRQR
jgi:colanic acid/amylovoran biosynthesis glycosyltransferase